ncbi:MAG TPA: nuclear transport factor 2 family protein [Pyrinomonadaceae bacterium]
MKTLLKVSLLAIAGFALMSCAPPANTNTNANSNANTNAASRTAAPPTADALMAMDNQAWEAWKNKNAKFFEGMLADTFVGFDDKGVRSTRADMLKAVAEHKCEVKSYSLSDPHVTSVSPDVAVLTYKATQDATCDGKKLPGTVRAASVVVRSGDTWKGAYHNEVAIVESPAASSNTNSANTTAPPVLERKETPAANSATAANTNTAAPTSGDALTDELMAVEKRGWEGWMRKDAAALEAVTGKDVTFVDAMGRATMGQTNVIKIWTDETCKVSSVNVSDGKATMIANNVAILTYKGTAEGTCGTMKLEPLWGTTVAVKEGNAWKAVYIFETPMA